MILEVLIAVVIGLIALNVFVTYRVIRDDLAEPIHRVTHILLVWLVPVVGALIVLHLQRKSLESASGRYHEPAELRDDVGGPRYQGSRLHDSVDGDGHV